MSIDVFINAFRLPAQTLVVRRILKKLLVKQGAPTAADRHLINVEAEHGERACVSCTGP